VPWIAAGAVIVCGLLYWVPQRPKSTVTTKDAPQPTTPTLSASPARVTPPPPSAPPPVPAQPSPAPVQAAAQKPAEQKPLETKPAEPKPAGPKPVVPNPAVPNPDATVHIQIVAEEAVWVLARADGKYAFSATLNPGDTRQVEGVKDVVLRLGNAGGVAITLNGKPLGPVGPKGQARTLQLTSGGFQIVPAKPPSAPLDPIDRL
jgi:cytoskeleton protein RodZ